MCIRDRCSCGARVGTPDTITDGVVTNRSVTATSAVVLFPEEGSTFVRDASSGAFARRGSKKRSMTRKATVKPFLGVSRGSLPLLEIA